MPSILSWHMHLPHSWSHSKILETIHIPGAMEINLMLNLVILQSIGIIVRNTDGADILVNISSLIHLDMTEW